MRTAILGAKGQLGRDLMQVFGKTGEVEGFDLPELDVAEPGAVAAALELFRPEFIVNAAAFTNVEGAEDDPEGAYHGNETGARRAAEAARDLGAHLILISTDFVFDGKKREPYLPDDPAGSLSVYGQSKRAGEMATLNVLPQAAILRTAWLYGPGGNNFPEKIIAAAQSRPELTVVSDEIGSPTHTWDLAEAVHAAARVNLSGIHHAVNRGQCTRDEFAREILRLAGLNVPVKPCGSDAFPTKAARPKYSVLSVDSFEKATGHTMRDWQPALEHYIARRAKA